MFSSCHILAICENVVLLYKLIWPILRTTKNKEWDITLNSFVQEHFFVSQHNIGLNRRKLAIIFILQLINNKYNFALKRPNGEAGWHIGMSSVSGSEGPQFKPW